MSISAENITEVALTTLAKFVLFRYLFSLIGGTTCKYDNPHFYGLN